MKQSIVIDIDGTMQDYNKAYSEHWTKLTGIVFNEVKPAYWAVDQYDVPILKDDHLSKFLETFDESFWSSVKPLCGAVVAVNKLAEHYDIYAMSTSYSKYNDVRHKSLIEQGFKIKETISVGKILSSRHNPKGTSINRILPFAVIDDLPLGLCGLNDNILKFLIARNSDDINSPYNVDKELIRSIHNLAVFKQTCDYKVSGLVAISKYILNFYKS